MNTQTELAAFDAWSKRVDLPFWERTVALSGWQARASLAQGDAAAPAAPTGYVLVPLEPTPQMLDVGQHVNSEWLNDSAPIGEHLYRLPAHGVYQAMIAAAAPPSGTQGDAQAERRDADHDCGYLRGSVLCRICDLRQSVAAIASKGEKT